jgi:FkbM family methyltransferase
MLDRVTRGLKRLIDPGASTDNEYFRVSFSQGAEDLILLTLFSEQADGFYVDVGAHHPRKYSNTFAFYDRGWSGINIDAMPGSMTAFQASRPRDINLEQAISDRRQTLTFYEFNEPALNGFDADAAKARSGLVPPGGPPDAELRIVAERQLETATLAEVLAKHLPPGREVDFLTVDVEGLDYEVLASNDWSRVRPTAVLVEDGEVRTLDDLATSRVAALLGSHGYAPLCKTLLTTIYTRTDRVEHGQFGPRLVRR